MASTIEGYLAELRAALAGADPALIQDALYDAEEYLRSATTETGQPASLEVAVEDYGTPEEVAAAYRDAEITVAAALRTPALAGSSSPMGRSAFGRFVGVIADPQAWGSLFYLLLALATGIVYFTVVVTGLSVSLGTMILIVGLPIALLFLAVVRAVSFAEGRIVEGLLGIRMPRRPRTVATGDGGVISRVKGWLTDYRSWTTMLYMLLQLPLGVTYFTIIVTGIATSVALIVAPFAQVVADHPVFISGDYGYYVEWWGMPFMVLGGLLGILLTLWVAKGIGHVHGQFAKVMLVGRIDQPAAGAVASPTAQSGAPVPTGAEQ